MRLGFFGGKKEEGKRVRHTEVKGKLWVICENYGAPDLYNPLHFALHHDPSRIRVQEEDVEKLLTPTSRFSYYLYKKRDDEARKVLDKVLKGDQSYKPKFEPILENFDLAVKIAREWWKEEGVYKEIEERKITASKP
jgi:hypothetical protein